MKLPLVLEESGTVRDADGRVVISKINPCTITERREIVHAVNMLKDMERKIVGQRAAIRALESKISQPHRVARMKRRTQSNGVYFDRSTNGEVIDRGITW